MIKKINILQLLFFGLSVLQAQVFPEAVTLEEAIEFGLENNRNIINANLEVQKAYKEKWKTIAIGLPQLSARADYQNFIELPTSLIPAQFFGGNDGEFAEVQFGTPQTMSAGITLNQLIFDGSYVVGIEATKVYLDASKNILEKTVLEIRKNIVNSYFSVLLVRANIGFLKKNRDNLNSNLTELIQLFKNGFDEEQSVEQLRLTLSSVENQLRYAQDMERTTLNMLKLLLGFPTASPLFLSESLEVLSTPDLFQITTEEFKTENNIDVKIAENNLLSEDLLYRYERSKSLPRISAFINGNYTGNSESFTFTNVDQKWFGASLFGVKLQVPIFSSLKRRASSQKAKISVSQARFVLKETKERIFIETQAASNKYKLAVENYFNAKENLALANRIKDKNQIKYFEGMVGSFELRQAQLQLYGAQNNYLKAIQSVVQKKITLETLLNTSQQ